jgi:hypothetical protein
MAMHAPWLWCGIICLRQLFREGVLKGGNYRVRCVAEQADAAALDVRVRVVEPEAPGLDLDAECEVCFHACVEGRVRRQQLFDGAVVGAPGLVGVVALFAREEAVV